MTFLVRDSASNLNFLQRLWFILFPFFLQWFSSFSTLGKATLLASLIWFGLLHSLPLSIWSEPAAMLILNPALKLWRFESYACEILPTQLSICCPHETRLCPPPVILCSSGWAAVFEQEHINLEKVCFCGARLQWIRKSERTLQLAEWFIRASQLEFIAMQIEFNGFIVLQR